MQRRAATYLWDADEACGLVIEFVADRGFEDYEQDALVRSAVERQLTILGEALNRFSQLEPELAARLSDIPKIVALRNIVVHAYADVDHAAVWTIVSERLPPLRAELQVLLREVTD